MLGEKLQGRGALVDDGAHAAEQPESDSSIGATTKLALDDDDGHCAAVSDEAVAMAVDPRIETLEKMGSCRDSGQGSPDSHKEDGPASDDVSSSTTNPTVIVTAVDDGTPPADGLAAAAAGVDGVLPAASRAAASTDSNLPDDGLEELGEPSGSGLGALDSLLGWSLDNPSPRNSPPPPEVVSGGKGELPVRMDVDLGSVGAAGPADLHAASEMMAAPGSLVSTQDDIAARQTMVEGRLAAARAQLARQQTLTTLWLSARTSNPAELWHVPETGLKTDELATAARRLKARTAGLLHHRKRSRNGRAARHAAREVQRMVETSAEAADPEATDISSCDSSESEAELDPTRPAPPQRDRKKRRRVQSVWDRDRAEVGWRWNWLNLRLRVIKQGIDEYKDLETQLAANKLPVELSTIDEVGTEGTAAASIAGASCARSRPLAASFRHRRLVQDRVNVPPSSQIRPVSAPLVHSDRNAIRARSALLDRGFHVVLSLPSDAPHSVIQKARAHRRMLRQQALQRQKHMQQAARDGRAMTGQRHTSQQQQHQQQQQQQRHHQQQQQQRQQPSCRPGSTEDDASLVPTSLLKGKGKRGSSSRISVSVCSVEPDAGTPPVSGKDVPISPPVMAARTETLLARRKRKENSQIDDVVMPNLTPARFEPLLVKEILTPSWRTRSGTNTPGSADSTLGHCAAAGDSPFSPALAGVEETEDMNRLLDSVCVERHAPCELKERQRALGIVSETGQRSSVAGGEARPRDHSKGPLVRLIENRCSTVQKNPGYSARTFPLVGDDLADILADLLPPPEIFPQLSDLEAAEAAADAALASGDVPRSASPAVTIDAEEKPIKLLFKLRATPDTVNP
jgi:hypothetical protein